MAYTAADSKGVMLVDLSQDEVRVLLAVKLFERGEVSLGQGAKLAGFSKRDFMDLLGQCRVPIYNYTSDELREETSP